MKMQCLRLRRSPRMPRRPAGRRLGGYTLMETLVSMALMMVTMSAVGAMMLLSARSTRELYAHTRGRSSRMLALDQIRYRLTDARIGTVEFLDGDEIDGYRTILFLNPNTGTGLSRFHYDAEMKTLFFDDDFSDGGYDQFSVGDLLADVRFRSAAPDAAVIGVIIRTITPVGPGQVDSQEGDTLIYLRNS